MKKVITLVLLLCMIGGGLVLSESFNLRKLEKLVDVAEGPNWPPDDGITSLVEYL